MTTTPDTTSAQRNVDEEPLFLTPVETAIALGITTDELREMREAGSGPRFAILGKRTTLYWRELVLEWEEQHRLEFA
jgi:hypothetical protein